jgi:hypothetical protein
MVSYMLVAHGNWIFIVEVAHLSDEEVIESRNMLRTAEAKPNPYY